MNKLFGVAAGLALGICASWSACGPAKVKCDTVSCPSGCCDATGTCQAGNTPAACGTSAVQCLTCIGAQTCSFGVCMGSISQSGGGSASGGGASTGGGSVSGGGSAAGGGSASGGGSAAGGGSASGGGTAGWVVFITSVGYTGNLGGLSGADAKCALHATAANLPGNFKALLGTQGNAPEARFTGGPWYALDGTKIFNNRANLATVPLSTPLTDENGNQIFRDVWVGENGADLRVNCSDWTSASGDLVATSGKRAYLASWGNRAGDYCAASHPLLCLQQP